MKIAPFFIITLFLLHSTHRIFLMSTFRIKIKFLFLKKLELHNKKVDQNTHLKRKKVV